MVIKMDDGTGGKMEVSKDLVERILDKATVITVNLNIEAVASLGGVVTPPVVEPAVEEEPAGETPVEQRFPNTTFVTVNNPNKAHALLTTWRNKNTKHFPLFTAWPTDNPDHEPLRIKIPNGTRLLVDNAVVKGDSNQYAYKIVDWDGYFAGLNALGKNDEPLDVNKIYMRKEWTVEGQA